MKTNSKKKLGLGKVTVARLQMDEVKSGKTGSEQLDWNGQARIKGGSEGPNSPGTLTPVYC